MAGLPSMLGTSIHLRPALSNPQKEEPLNDFPEGGHCYQKDNHRSADVCLRLSKGAVEFWVTGFNKSIEKGVLQQQKVYIVPNKLTFLGIR